MNASVRLFELFDRLMDAFGPQGWWPLTPPGGGLPQYRAGRWQDAPAPRQVFEVGVGAVLTQRANWSRVEPVLARLSVDGLLSARALRGLPEAELEERLRPCGPYRRKVTSLRAWSDWCVVAEPSATSSAVERASIHSLPGFGPETVDSILLYGWGEPRFVADAYARRILERVGGIATGRTYETLRTAVGRLAVLDRRFCDESHALLVELGKRHCRTKPRCEGCPLAAMCHFARTHPD